jgi:hypothetical protein
MRDLIRRALADPPPRGAVIVVVAGLVVTLAAVLLSRTPGASGSNLPYQAQTDLPGSKSVPFGKAGSTQIVGGKLSKTAADATTGERVFTIETSLRAHAGSGAKVTSVRCELLLAKGVHFGQSEGRRAVYPRPLANTADDAIKEGVPVDFLNGGTEQAGIGLRNVFFKYVRGGNPSVDWPGIDVGKQVWLWKYPKPVAVTHDNFAAILTARGGQTVSLACTPSASKVTGGGTRGVATSATVRTQIKLH